MVLVTVYSDCRSVYYHLDTYHFRNAFWEVYFFATCGCSISSIYLFALRWFFKRYRWGGKEVMKRYKKSAAREWVDAAVFAVVAATLIRTFIFEAYTIPTESMEKTLLINDFLFVNKMSYGATTSRNAIKFSVCAQYFAGYAYNAFLS